MNDLMLPLLLPGVAGLVVLALPRRLRPLDAWIGVLGAGGALVSGFRLLGARDALSIEWVRLGPLNLDLSFRADGFSGWAAAFVGLMTFLVVVYSIGWFRGRGGAPARFHGLLLLAAAGANGVVLSDNVLLLAIFWEIVTLVLFLLVASGREEGSQPAAKAFAVIGFGDTTLLLGIVLLAVARSAAGHDRPLAVPDLAAAPLATDSALGVATFALLFLSAAAKAGAVPLHSWIPTMAEGAHPPVMALLPGSLDKVLGIYLLARLAVEWTVLSPGIRLSVMLVGAVTILAAVFMAMVQHDLRRLLAFHAVSQVGYMVLGIGTGTVVGVMGGIFHMLNNSIYKACLFLGAGVVEREAGTNHLDRLGGLAGSLPVTMGAMLVAALAISGLPPMNGFASKWLVYQGCVAAGAPLFLVVALFGSALTLASFAKVLHSVFWGPRPPDLGEVRESGISMRFVLVVLATLCVLMGVFAAVPLDRAIGPAAGVPAGGLPSGVAALEGAEATWGGPGAVVSATGAARALYRPVAVAGMLFLSILVVVALLYAARVRIRRVPRVFFGGEPLDPAENRFPGTEFYRTIAELPAVGPALRTGERGSLDAYRILEKSGGRVVEVLRRLHSGLLTDYLFWCLLGLVAVLGVLVWG